VAIELALIDAARTPWYDCFFERFPYNDVSDLLSGLGVLDLDVDILARTDDLRMNTLSGWTYWVLYLRGYLQYCRRGGVDEDNIYWRYLTRYFGPRGHDPGLVETLADPLAVRSRIALRFLDIDALRNSRRSLSPAQLKSIILQVASQPSSEAKILYRKNDEIPLPAAFIDGYHRLFIGRMFRLAGVQARILWPFK
jgi:hypothetical protein